MADHVDLVLGQWGAQRPDLDVSPMAVIGRLSRASRLIGNELGKTFAAHGLDSASFDVLATLRRSGPDHRLTPAELMRAAMVTSGAITQRLDRLQARGLVTRTPSESDGRVVHVSLTEEGLALIDRTLPDHLATERGVLAGLTGADLGALAGLLRELLESLGDTVPEEQIPRRPSREGSENEFCETASEDFRASPVRVEYAGHGRPGGPAGGRPKVIDEEMLTRARELRAQGMPVAEIAARLTIRTGKNAGRPPSVASLYRALAE
ncbi:MarR family transcriptional regulator [Streptomyces sp. t39]|uniref:MarR family transcriptional regulator n=1 Tax=Streptomyces sp. t39 TaxID=1828156 RepID=UPI0011CD8D86|nr:MarR family transcriptional regulator [Streptomyces sp. t39]TXS51334.1 MarR family transcriptional regulator [Streptomyces sp. t39]